MPRRVHLPTIAGVIVTVALLTLAATRVAHRGLDPATPLDHVVVYSDGTSPDVEISRTALAMRSVRFRVEPFNPRLLPATNLGDEMRRSGMLDGRGDETTYDVPVRLNGELIRSRQLWDLLAHHPVTQPGERAGRYIVVYGPTESTETHRLAHELLWSGLTFEFRDVDDPRHRPGFEARLIGYERERLEWPFVDVNGRLMSAPTLARVEAFYR